MIDTEEGGKRIREVLSSLDQTDQMVRNVVMDRLTSPDHS